MTTMTLRLAGVALAASVAALGLTVVAPQPAEACTAGTPGCPPPDKPKPDTQETTPLSSRTQTAQLDTPTRSCSVYANGGGMGMYCVELGGDAKTLRERFGKQKLQACRYSELPPTIEAPYNADPANGRYMLMSCLENIDFDTFSGGPDRTISLSIVFVEEGTDVEDRHNDITDFLWRSFADDEPMPVPFMKTKPNATPLVGIPTYFTFEWRDPIRKTVVPEGPFREISEKGIVMRARATEIVINPRQKGIPAVTCRPDTPYREGAAPKDQPADACKITFPRSSASARKYATKPIPSNIKDAFYADVTVRWQVTYGAEGESMQTLGDGFVMRMRQVLPVQEVQPLNQPPAVIY